MPRTLAAHDFHPEGRVTHTIFAIIEIITPSRSRPTTRTSSPRPSMSRIPSLAEVSSASSSRMPSYAESSSASSSRMPSYAESSTSGAPLTPVVSGTHTPPYEDTVEIVKGKRTCMVVHENPGEGVINLDLKGEGVTPGLGVYNQHYTSDIVSHSSPLLADLIVDHMCIVQLQTGLSRSCPTHNRPCNRSISGTDYESQIPS